MDSSLATFLVGAIAAEHVGFLVLEMFLWGWAAPRIFGPMSVADAKVSKVLAGNMGLYNGFLAAGLIWGLRLMDLHITTFFLICVVAAGLYGAYSLKSWIVLVMQALSAAVALALLWVA
jgi:putative membrane protein